MDGYKEHNPDVEDPGYGKAMTIKVDISREKLIQIYRDILVPTHDTGQEAGL